MAVRRLTVLRRQVFRVATVVVFGALVLVPTAASSQSPVDQVGFHGVDGTLRRLVRKAHTRPKITAGAIDRFETDQLEWAAQVNEAWEKGVEAMLRDMPYPERIPAIEDMVADAGRNLWVGEYVGPEAAQRTWSVFDPAGRLIAAVPMPADLWVYDIGEDYVLGRVRDELDVEHIHLYRLWRE